MTNCGRCVTLRNILLATANVIAGACLASAQEVLPLMATCEVFNSIDTIVAPESFSVAQAVQLTEQVLATAGLQRNFQVVATFDTSNADAIILRSPDTVGLGERFIRYNPDWVASTLSTNEWEVIGLLAHELGHHLQGHTMTCTGSNHQAELEADAFAGTALFRLGANLEEAQSLWQRLPAEASETHPSRSQRLEAVANGWRRAREIDDPEPLPQNDVEWRELGDDLYVRYSENVEGDLIPLATLRKVADGTEVRYHASGSGVTSLTELLQSIGSDPDPQVYANNLAKSLPLIYNALRSGELRTARDLTGSAICRGSVERCAGGTDIYPSGQSFAIDNVVLLLRPEGVIGIWVQVQD